MNYQINPNNGSNFPIGEYKTEIIILGSIYQTVEFSMQK
jgi:hypothetical protein